MPFVCGGYPGPGTLGPILVEVERAGASIVEIGFPFSDPIADGPVIAGAMHRALEQGCTPGGVLNELAAARASLTVGIVAMISVSLVWRLGAAGVLRRAREAGVDGLIIPDLPEGEGDGIAERAAAEGLGMSFLVAPSTSPERAEKIVRACSGFVYLVARAGVTGEGAGGGPDISERVAMLRGMTDLPIACGFGISTPEHVREVVRHADAAIVGSALVRRIGEAHDAGQDAARAAGLMVRELAAGLV